MGIEKKMRLILFSLIISFSLNHRITNWTSEELWNYIEEEILINKTINSNYFVVDPNKFLSLVGSEKMNNIEEKQRELFNELKIPNYIIYVSNLNENLENFTFSISKKLNNAFPEVNISNSIISVFSIFDKKMRMRTGSKLKYSLSDSKCYEILINRRKDLGKRNYDKVCVDLLDEVYIFFTDNSFTFWIGIIIFFFLWIIGFIISVFNSMKNNKEKDKLFKIKDFLQKVKTDKKIIYENCVICLDNLIEENKDNKNVSSLPCGHQFHTKCIIQWMLKSKKCPLCRSIINKSEDDNLKDNNDNNNNDNVNFNNLMGDSLSERIWEVQTEVYPQLNSYSYCNLWNSNSSCNDYSYDKDNDTCFEGRDFDCGGGATANW